MITGDNFVSTVCNRKGYQNLHRLLRFRHDLSMKDSLSRNARSLAGSIVCTNRSLHR